MPVDGEPEHYTCAEPLNERTLRRHSRRVTVPTYDRAALRGGVVHIGVGSFHRSHQAVYFDDLARRGLGDGWALTGIGLHRPEMKAALAAQDGLYTVVARGDHGDAARIVGVLTRYLFAPEEADGVRDVLADATTRLVTLTITGHGYLPRETSFGSAVALLVAALDRRRRLGRRPFTVLSCDNIPHNGEIAREAVVAAAHQHDAELARWIAEAVAFPSSMVDRITPSTTDSDREMVEREFGVRDLWPVMTEPYSDWIVEDAFCNGRPPLEEVGVAFVDDVRPYAIMKTRLLNGAHSALGYLGTLAGYERIDQVITDPVFAGYAEQLMDAEIAPLLDGVDADVPAYCATLRGRFANRAVADRLSRLCRNGSAKVPAHLLSSIEEARRAGQPHPLLTLAVSAWCRYLRGDMPDGRRVVVDDPDGARLQKLALQGGSDPRPLLADALTFGSLGRCPRFAAEVERDLRELEFGARAAIARHTARELMAA